MNERLPETAAQLFDLCHELFGIGGEFDADANPSPPWFKVRMNEIGKLNRILKARRVEVRSMGLAARYCHRHGITIKATGELLPYIAPALVEVREQKTMAKAYDLYDRLNHAARVATDRGDSALAERIVRIPYAAAADLLPAIERELGIS